MIPDFIEQLRQRLWIWINPNDFDNFHASFEALSQDEFTDLYRKCFS